MQAFIDLVLTLPTFIVSGVLGALGALLGYAIAAPFKNRTVTICIVAALVVSAPATARMLLKPLRIEAHATKAVETMKQQRLYAVIAEHHPDAMEKFRADLLAVARQDNVSAEEAFQVGMTSMNGIITEYMSGHIPLASDAAIHAMLRASADTMRVLARQPEKCVGYYLGTPKYTGEDANDQELMKAGAADRDAKAAVIESAVKTPTKTPEVEAAAVFETLARAYSEKGYDPANLEKLGEVGTLPADQGCRIGAEFAEALAHLKPADGAIVYKNLIRLSSS